jgi:hypothetical protein
LIGDARHGRADHPDRGALRIGREYPEGAGRDGDLHAAGQHGLQALGAALGIERLDREAVLLEDAETVADLRNHVLQRADVAAGDLELILRECRCGEQQAGQDSADETLVHFQALSNSLL